MPANREGPITGFGGTTGGGGGQKGGQPTVPPYVRILILPFSL